MVVLHFDLRALRRSSRAPTHQIGELAVVAAEFVADAEVVEDVHQPLLLAVGLDEPARVERRSLDDDRVKRGIYELRFERGGKWDACETTT
jgi:hypothetical protein